MSDNTSGQANAQREQWVYSFLNWAHEELFVDNLPTHEPIPYRIAFGFPPGMRGGKNIAGACVKRALSGDAHNEIFINPTIDKTQEVMITALHELCHAADDCESGHKGAFAKLAKSIGLLAPMKSTPAGPELQELLDWYVSEYGDIPAAPMQSLKSKPSQGTRMIKVACSDPLCGFHFRASMAQIAKMPPRPACPACGESEMAVIV